MMADPTRSLAPIHRTITGDERCIRTIEQEIVDLGGSGSGGAASIDVLYGDTLIEQLPPRLTDLLNGRRAA